MNKVITFAARKKGNAMLFLRGEKKVKINIVK